MGSGSGDEGKANELKPPLTPSTTHSIPQQHSPSGPSHGLRLHNPMHSARPSVSSSRRSRAPTINIDTSAVSIAPPPESSSDPHHVPERTSPSTWSRPTSAHNVSMSPVGPEGHKTHLLAPDTARRPSFDPNESNISPTSYGGPTLPSSGSTFNEVLKVDTAQSENITTNLEDALRPDANAVADFQVDNNPFAFSPGQLNKMLGPKSLKAFYALGGLVGLAKGLRTDAKSGLSLDETTLTGTVSFEEATTKPEASRHSSDETEQDSPQQSDLRKDIGDDKFVDRKRVFNDNTVPPRKPKSFWYLVWAAYNDKMILLLTAAAVVSLALGIYEAVDYKQHGGDDPGKALAWVEGVAIVVAILIVVSAGALNDWQKERQFSRLNKIKEERKVTVIRSGGLIDIPIENVLVGDLVRLEAGDILPADGIIVSGYSIICNESNITGESDQLRKCPADVAWKAIVNHEPLKKIDPFILSGAQVTEGVGTFLATSTGINSSHGKIMMALQDEPNMTPLQSKLNTLAEYIAKLGLAAGLLLLIATAIRFGIRVSAANPPLQGQVIGQEFLQIFIVAVTVIVVAVPEGLPLAVTLALSFAMTKMLKDNNLVRRMQACETMGNATTVCSDKTGTLTQNNMKVVAGTIGLDNQFKPASLIENLSETTSISEKHSDKDFKGASAAEAAARLSKSVSELLKQSIAINSTAFEADDGSFVGSKTEVALLNFAKDHLGMLSVREERAATEVVQLIPFDSKRKCMGTVIKTKGTYRLLVKGASELMINECSKIVRDNEDLNAEPLELTKEHRDSFLQTIETYASQSLRTIAVLYQDFPQWPPVGAARMSDNPGMAVFEDVFQNMTLLSIVGIKDPLRDGVPEAVKKCQHAGVTVRMVTGDNLLTAKAIAKDCGILTDDANIMEGQEFRNLSTEELNKRLPTLQVLARSSPEDKRVLVKRLQAMGDVVAVTGDGTNDAPALNTADVGFSMGIAGTEVAKAASAIILMDDNFASIVNAILWGRAVNDAVKKFLQFQVTVNITAVVLTFVSAVSSDEQDSILSAVQLLWVNLIMDTLAALALATDPPTLKLLDRKPDKRNASLITATMWKMIIGQAIFQLAVTLTLYYGRDVFPIYTQDASVADQESALVFNVFVWMQIFNQYNSRRLDNNYNIFEGVYKNYYFLVIQVLIVGGQVLIMFVGSDVFNLKVRLTPGQWGISIILGLLSIPFAVVIRTIPDLWCERPVRYVWNLIPSWMKHTPWYYVKRLFGRKTRNTDEESTHANQINGLQWHEGIEEIRDSLSFAKWLHGGRLNQVRSKIHPLDKIRKPRSSAPPTPARSPSRPPSSVRSSPRSRANSGVAAAAAMSGIVAGAVAGWGGPPSATAEHPPKSLH